MDVTIVKHKLTNTPIDIEIEFNRMDGESFPLSQGVTQMNQSLTIPIEDELIGTPKKTISELIEATKVTQFVRL